MRIGEGTEERRNCKMIVVRCELDAKQEETGTFWNVFFFYLDSIDFFSLPAATTRIFTPANIKPRIFTVVIG